MTRSELIDRLAEKFPSITAADMKFVVTVLLERISYALVQGDRVEIRGFGSFSTTRRPPRIGRNPRTGQPVNVPSKILPHFKPGRDLRQRVNF